jgi:hypothetical protein
MLTRGRLLAVPFALMLALGPAVLARADGTGGGGADCPPDRLDCNVHATNPGSSGSGTQAGIGGGAGSGRSGTQTCTLDGKAVRCYRAGIGWFNSGDGCYWLFMDPQPPVNDPSWKLASGIPADWKPGQGKLYNVTCPGQPLAGGWTWGQNPPPGYGGGPNLAAVAQEAVTKMRLLGADVGIAPKPGSKGGSVGLPVWVWNNESPRTTGPTSASATALGVTVTATATVQNVAWNFGNGTTANCAFPGKPYVSSYGAQVPDKSQGECGFAGYQSTGNYTVTATTTWAVHWVGGGQQGDLTTTRTSQVQIRIGEVQVVG